LAFPLCTAPTISSSLYEDEKNSPKGLYGFLSRSSILAFSSITKGVPMTRKTLTKKQTKELRKAGGSSGGKRTYFLLGGITALVLLATLAFSVFVSSGSDNNFTPNDKGLLPVGSQAPDFNTQTIDGGNVSLDDSGDYRATMLVFFASWCPHCNREAPTISELQGQHKDLRVIMMGIDGQDDSQKVQEFVNKYNIDGPAAYDPSVGSTYQASGYPTIYLIDGNDQIVAAHSGEVPKDVLEGWIEKSLGSSSG
jgi:thiol-disulfide isomerase/thioredoxin